MSEFPTPRDDLPRVAISEFKANPVKYSRGVTVTNHGRDQFVFLPVAADERQDLESVKAQLRLLSRLRNPSDVAIELAEISESRDGEHVGDAR